MFATFDASVVAKTLEVHAVLSETSIVLSSFMKLMLFLLCLKFAQTFFHKNVFKLTVEAQTGCVSLTFLNLL